MIAGVPQLGVIFDPFHKELFVPLKDWGHPQPTYQGFRDSPVEQQSFGYGLLPMIATRQLTTTTRFCHLTHLTQGVRRSGSAALDQAPRCLWASGWLLRRVSLDGILQLG